MMEMVLEKLEPQIVWDIFENVVAKTPRPSKKEGKIRKVIKSWIEQKGKDMGINFRVLESDIGNILIKKPPSEGKEGFPEILLQAHMDMVCESDREEDFDFEEKGIPLRIQENGEWVDAEGTTLGADDGIGLAFALALLTDPDLKHGPIEVLFTVNEENGFTGASNLNPEELEIESRYMINLDSGPLGDVVMGSVCGRRVYFSKEFTHLKCGSETNLIFYELEINGLKGGHSGGDIHLPRANANKLISRMLSAISEKLKVHICEWNGGTVTNVIPRQSSLSFAVIDEALEIFEEEISKERKNLYEYYKQSGDDSEPLEPDLSIEWKQVESRPYLSHQDSKEILSYSHIIPSGVIRYSPFFENFVETSCNLGVIVTEDSKFEIRTYPRSLRRPELHNIVRRFIQLADLKNWETKLFGILPEWTPKPDSPFLKYIKKQYEAVIEGRVKLNVVHGGLETGMISQKIPGITMASLGPTVEGEHSPTEKVRIEDVGKVYNVLKRVLENFNQVKKEN